MVSERYAREYLCPDPAEHGKIVYIPGILRGHWPGRQKWLAMAEIPDCPLCGARMVHDTDDRPPDVEIVLIHRDERAALGETERKP